MGRAKRTEISQLPVEEKQPVKDLPLETCSMFMEKCKHCSREHAFRPYTKIVKDTTGLFKPVGIGNMNVDLGLYCNDAGEWVDRMSFCPVKWDKANYADVMKEYNAKQEKERVKEERKKAREKAKKVVIKKIIKKPVKKVVAKKKPVKGVTKRKL
ncbi:MAG: hypothetical protein WCX79_00205 [Candidatus Paceibacterota bacterium]|jgi:hypothetical protein